MAATNDKSRFRAERFRSSPARSRGATLLEVLVSLLIATFGLLGLAGMQAIAHQSSLESYQRAQALVLLYDMVDRINANRNSAGCYAFTTGAGTAYVGDTSGGGHLGTANCATGFSDAHGKDAGDAGVNDWNRLLQGAAETSSGGASVGAMMGARGCISFNAATNIYTIAVAWQGISDTFAPVVDCANGLYGTETKRRVVWTTLRIGNLSAL